MAKETRREFDFDVEILKVRVAPNDNGRLLFDTNTSFIHYNENGEEVETKTFSISIISLVEMVGLNAPFTYKAEMFRMGRYNQIIMGAFAEIVNFEFNRAKCSIHRVEKFAGEQREATNDTYTNNNFKTIISGDSLKLSHLFDDECKELIAEFRSICRENNKTEKKNPFNL